MVVQTGLWSLELIPGKVVEVDPRADLRITNVSFGDVLKDHSCRSVVKIEYRPYCFSDSEDLEEEKEYEGPKTLALCSLKPGSFEQASTDILLQKFQEYNVEVTGKNVVYLSGNYLEKRANNLPFKRCNTESSSESESDYSHDEDCEMHDMLPSDTSRFEEVDEIPKPLKHPRQSEDESNAARPLKAQKKKKGALNEKTIKTTPANETAGKNDANAQDSKKGKQDTNPADNKSLRPNERYIAGGIKVFDAKIGAGPAAKKGNMVSMRYIGKLQNGNVFDKNVSGTPFTFNLGKGEVIKGWDEGVVGMQIGGERRITIPPDMAYGKKAMGDIPKNSTLIFDIKMLKIR